MIGRSKAPRAAAGRPAFCSGWRLLSAAVIASVVCVATAAGAEPGAAPAPGIISRIDRRPVESRALAAVGSSTRLRALEIEFRRGGTYRYLNVPPAVHRDLLASDSKARFYNTHVRGRYASVFVRPRRRQ